MLKPPFKLATSASSARASAVTHAEVGCCAVHEASATAAPNTRAKLTDLDPHLHCSIIGTCLSTAELRKLMARFMFVGDRSDLEVHHEAVKHAAEKGPVVKSS
jgi:hypothetical protein